MGHDGDHPFREKPLCTKEVAQLRGQSFRQPNPLGTDG
jgi:hypothetical protein